MASDVVTESSESEIQASNTPKTSSRESGAEENETNLPQAVSFLKDDVRKIKLDLEKAEKRESFMMALTVGIALVVSLAFMGMVLEYFIFSSERYEFF